MTNHWNIESIKLCLIAVVAIGGFFLIFLGLPILFLKIAIRFGEKYAKYDRNRFMPTLPKAGSPPPRATFPTLTESKIKAELEKIRALQKKAINSILFSIFLFFAIGFGITNSGKHGILFNLLAFASLILNFVIFIGIFPYNIYKKSNALYFKLLQNCINRVFPSLRADSTKGVDKKYVEESQLIQDPTLEYFGSGLFIGNIQEKPFQISAYRLRSQNNNNNFFSKGIFFVADLQLRVRSKILIEPDIAEAIFGSLVGKTLQNMVVGEKIVDLEDPEFENEFRVIAEDQIDARRILNPAIMEHLRQFRLALGLDIRLTFINGKFFAMIPYHREIFSFEYDCNYEDMAKIVSLFELIDKLATAIIGNSVIYQSSNLNREGKGA